MRERVRARTRGREGRRGTRTHDELALLFLDDLLVPLCALPQAVDLCAEAAELVALVAAAVLLVAQAVGEGEEALGVGRLDAVLLREVGTSLGELLLERGDEGGSKCAARRARGASGGKEEE